MSFTRCTPVAIAAATRATGREVAAATAVPNA